MTTVPTMYGEESGGMAYYLNSTLKHDTELPLRESPIRFAVMRRNGLSSNAWRVWVEESGDMYIAGRDHMKTLKISLHKSGKHHIAFTSESGLEMTAGSRFWDQWSEPNYDGSKVAPTFNLFFPSWGLNLTQDLRDADAGVWDKNQISVEAAESPVATRVSFVITDADFTMRFSTGGDSPSFPLGVVSTESGKKLWVIASYSPEGNMKELAGKGIRELQSSLNGAGEASYVDMDIVEKLREMPSGHVLGMCVSGLTKEGGAFLMPFAVETAEGTAAD